MSENPFDLFIERIREVVREEIKAALGGNGNGHSPALLNPEALADKLNVPVSWVYEQSRQGAIPTHRLGRYIRFSLMEVLDSQKTKNNP
jgi:hypothetical protein